VGVVGVAGAWLVVQAQKDLQQTQLPMQEAGEDIFLMVVMDGQVAQHQKLFWAGNRFSLVELVGMLEPPEIQLFVLIL
jgi:hypothetical protein